MAANTVRALVYVSDVLERKGPDGEIVSQVVKLSGVYASNPDSPDYGFWKATPILQHEMTITNPEVFDFFVPGKKLHLDFTSVEG